MKFIKQIVNLFRLKKEAPEQDTPEPTPSPPEDIAPPRDMFQKLYEDCKQQGYEAARITGDLTHDKVRVAIARENISARVDALYEGPFDPKQPRDALLLQVQTEAAEEARRNETRVANARLRCDVLEEAVPAYEAPPLPPLLVILFLILALETTFGLCLLDLPILQGIEDALSRLILSLGMGLPLSASCVVSMFNVSSYSKETSIVLPKQSGSIWGFVGWIAISAGFAFVRYSTSGDDLQLTLGLFGIDLGLIAYSKLCAVQHHNRVWVHAERNNGRLQSLKRAEDAKRELERADKGFALAEKRFRTIRLEFEERLKKDFDREAVKRAAFASWHDGYSKGCDENRAPRGVPKSAPFTNQPRNAA